MSRIPKRVNYRKAFKGTVSTSQIVDHSFTKEYGLVAVEAGRVTERQIEASRRAIVHHLKRKGRLAINIFPDIPVTAKPKEVRMGRGKGNVEFWICRVRKGKLLYQVDGVARDVALSAFRLATAKLPIKTKVKDVTKRNCCPGY